MALPSGKKGKMTMNRFAALVIVLLFISLVMGSWPIGLLGGAILATILFCEDGELLNGTCRRLEIRIRRWRNPPTLAVSNIRPDVPAYERDPCARNRVATGRGR